MPRKSLKSFHLDALNLHVLPILVWSGALLLVTILFFHRSRGFETVGLVQGRIYQVASIDRSRLKSVSVELFERVEKGQILAVLDDESLRIDRKTDFMMRYRQFANDTEESRARILKLNTTLEPDFLYLKDLELEIKITEDLLSKGAISPYELQKVQTAYSALARKVEENQFLLTQYQRDFKTALKRRDEFAEQRSTYLSAEYALEVIGSGAEDAQGKRILDELLRERATLVLRSPCAGVVSHIYNKPGETVLPGEAILTIAETNPSQVITYIPESRLGRVRENLAVKIVKNSYPYQIASSRVIYLGPTVEMLPERLWYSPNTPQWGHPLLIEIPAGFQVMPGERVGIKGL